MRRNITATVSLVRSTKTDFVKDANTREAVRDLTSGSVLFIALSGPYFYQTVNIHQHRKLKKKKKAI